GALRRGARALQGGARRGTRDRRPVARPAGRSRGRLPARPGAHRQGPRDDGQRRSAARHRGARRPRRGRRRTGALMDGARTAWQALRSGLFVLFQVVTVAPYALLCLAWSPLPLHWRYRLTVGWPRLVIWGARRIVGIRHRVIGTEHLPDAPAILLS